MYTEVGAQMSNIAGKAYALNVVTPMHCDTVWMDRLFFWAASLYQPFVAGLFTLSPGFVLGRRAFRVCWVRRLQIADA
jgi:hypothetical protein